MDEKSAETSFGIIASSGEARSKAFEALQLAKEEKFSEAASLMEESRKAGLAAHAIQTQLLSEAAAGKDQSLDILLVHAQDHLMTSILAQEMIEEIISVREELSHLKQRDHKN